MIREIRLAIDYTLGHNHLVQLTGQQLNDTATAAFMAFDVRKLLQRYGTVCESCGIVIDGDHLDPECPKKELT